MPSLVQAKFFSKLALVDELDEEMIYDEFSFEKTNQKEKIKLEIGKLWQYFSRGTTPSEMEEVILFFTGRICWWVGKIYDFFLWIKDIKNK